MPAVIQIKSTSAQRYHKNKVVGGSVLFIGKADGQILFSNADYGQNNTGPHALTSAETSAGIFPPEQQVIGYNSYDKAVSISEGNKQLQITYGHHRQRITQQYTQGSTTIAKLWAGACEYIIQNGQQKTLTYLSGPEGVFALHVKNPNGTENIRYIHKDHLGSWNTITDENGNLLQELSFDPWGSRRNPTTWRAFTGTPPAPLFDRGFTGHEHLFGFSLVNMNGRIYDPLVSRMLSPDNFIQAPNFSQSFNRYSYVWNNPLVYTDPSGEIVAPIIIGAVIGSYAGWQIGETAGAKGWSMVGYIAGGAAIGALSGGAASGVSALGGGAILTGAAGGAVGGAGFSGLATKWDGDAMVQGAFYGAVSGGFGGGIGAVIGGGAGAFAGGAVGSGINTALYGGSLDDIGISALMGGGMAFGAYHASSYIGWRFQGGKKWGDVDISYRQYTKMQADFQRSRFWRREYGGYLLEGGGVHRVPPGTNSQIDLGIAPDGAFAEYHTHWDRPGQVRYVDHSGNYVDPLQVALNTPVGEQAQVFKIITARYHGSWDLNTGGMDSFVINRYDASYYPGHGNYSVINPPINRFIYSFYFWLKR
jgi:RHS repeat-associated protein